MYGFSDEQLWKQKRKLINSGVLNLKIVMDRTDVMRRVDEDFWIKDLENGMDNECDKIIITDVRFIVSEEIKRLGGHLIWIERGLGGDEHISENSITKDYFDNIVENKDDITSLRKKYALLHNLL